MKIFNWLKTKINNFIWIATYPHSGEIAHELYKEFQQELRKEEKMIPQKEESKKNNQT